MLLCYDKLDKLTYLDGKLVKKDIYNGKKRTIRFYINVCKYCGEEFLSYKLNGKYCNNSCHFKFIHENMTEDDKIKFKNKISLTKKKNPSPAWNKRLFNYANYDTYEKKIGWINKVRKNIKEPRALETVCTYCGKWYIPTLEEMKARVNALYNGVDRTKFYCSQHCKDACPTFNKHSNIINKKQATSREVNTYLRQLVFERDNYTCQHCNEHDNIELHCHHILPLNESPIESADVDNCMTLCKKCHIKLHKTNGCKYHELKCS